MDGMKALELSPNDIKTDNIQLDLKDKESQLGLEDHGYTGLIRTARDIDISLRETPAQATSRLDPAQPELARPAKHVRKFSPMEAAKNGGY